MNTQTQLKPSIAPAPWYRHRWVWFIIALPLAVIFASFYTLYLAIKTDDGVIDDDYYKQGLAINQDINRDVKATQLGLNAELKITGTAILVNLNSTANNAGLTGMPIRLVMQNIGSKTEDQTVALVPSGENIWKGQFKQSLPAGHWQIRLETEQWRLIQTVQGQINNPILFTSKNN